MQIWDKSVQGYPLTQSRFFRLYAFTHWEKNKGFHAISHKLHWKWVISRNDAGKIYFSRVHAENVCFSHTAQSNSFHAFTKKRPIIQTYGAPQTEQLQNRFNLLVLGLKVDIYFPVSVRWMDEELKSIVEEDSLFVPPISIPGCTNVWNYLNLFVHTKPGVVSSLGIVHVVELESIDK